MDILPWGINELGYIMANCACTCSSCPCPCMGEDYSSGHNGKQQDNSSGNKAGGQI